MYPQDTRSPFEQQHWDIAINDEGFDIPPFACVMIVSNQVVNGETILHVKQPTADGMPNVMLNGMAPILAGKSGFVTRDYPALAIGTGAVPDMMGSSAGSFGLKKNVPGFIVLGTANDYVRVMYFFPAMFIRAVLDGDMCPEDTEATVGSVTFLQSCQPLTITTMKNELGLAALDGDIVYGVWNCTLNAWAILNVEHHSQTVVLGITSNTGLCRINEYVIEKVALQYCGAPVTQTAVQFYQSYVATNVRINDVTASSGVDDACQLQANIKQICSLNDLDSQGDNWTTVLDFTELEMMNNIRDDGTNIVGGFIPIYVACYRSPFETTVIATEVCPPPGSGSGSGGG